MADNFQAKDGVGTLFTIASEDSGGVHYPKQAKRLLATVVSGVVTAVGATAKALSASSLPVSDCVLIKAAYDNDAAEALWVGPAGVTVGVGFPLGPGESVRIPIADLEDVFLITDATAKSAYYVVGG